MRDLINSEIRGYRLDKLIGSGGFGAVYRAHQASVNREVAIKVILPEHANNPKFIRNFDAEAHLIARLEHPYVVPLFDYWREPNGAYIVMRYYSGGSLSQLLINEGALPAADVARLLDQIASALDAAHHTDMVHRDIKPANIMLDSDHNAYLGDFGLAKNLGDADVENRVVGSPAYIAPEVILRRSPDARTDLYSLGLVVHEMLTGRYAYLDVTAETSIHNILDFHLNVPPPDILNQSDAVNAVIQRATAKDPDDRYASASDFAAAFRDALEHDGESHLVLTNISNPYKGLRAFEEADASMFFGRTALIEKLIERMDEDISDYNFLTLIGPSGSGKSSVLYAGLLPALRKGAIPGSDDWYIVSMMPGSEPIKQLSAALRSVAAQQIGDIEAMLWQAPDSLCNLLPKILHSDDDTLLLVIDHFEEVFTQTANTKERKQFLALIREGLKSDHLRIITLLRADFYDRPLLYEGFGALIQRRTEIVLPLSTDELHDVITQPAKMHGLMVQPELIEAMIGDVKEEIGALPLLQYALTEMFEHRDGNTLTLEAYRNIGGVAGAVAHRAGEIYETLSPPEQTAARQIFLRLVTLGEGTEDTRRRARRTELLSVVDNNNHMLQSVLDTFGGYRLLTFDNDEETREPTVEVAHEALIREWQQLRKWLDNSRHDIRQQRAIYHDAIQWQNAEHETSYLLRGSHLEQLYKWSQSTNVSLNDLENRYLKASINEMEREQEAEDRRQQHEHALEAQSQQRLRYLVYVLLTAVIGAGLLTTYAFAQSRQARQAQNEAEIARETSDANVILVDSARQTSDANLVLAQEAEANAAFQAAEARSLALAASAQEALLLDEPDTALALAVQAIDIDDGPLTEPPKLAIDTFIAAAHAPGLIYERQVLDKSINHIAITYDGRYALLADGLNQTEHWGFGRPPEVSGRPPRIIPPDEIHIVIWDIEEREEVGIFTPHNAPITDIILLPPTDARLYRAISADGNGRVIFWDVETGEIQRELQFEARYTTLATDESGELLLITSSARGPNLRDTIAGMVTLVDTTTGEIIERIPEQRPDLILADLSPDGVHIVMTHAFGLHIVWDWESASTIASFQSEGAPRFASMDTIISPDSLTVATNIGGNEVGLWDIETGEAIGIARAGTTISHQIGFDTSGEVLFIASRDGLVSVWDITRNTIAETFHISGESLLSTVALSPIDETALIGTGDGVLRVYAVAPTSIGLIRTFSDEGISFGGTVLQDDGDTYLISTHLSAPESGDGNLVLWDLETAESLDYIASLENDNRTPFEFSLSPDRNWLLGVSGRGLRLWNMMSEDPDVIAITDCLFCNTRNIRESRINAMFIPHTGEAGNPLFALVAEENTLYHWNITQNEQAVLLTVDRGMLTDLAINDDGDVALLVFEPLQRSSLPGGQPGQPPPRQPDVSDDDNPETLYKLLWVDIASGDILYEVSVDNIPMEISFMPDSLDAAVALRVPPESIISDEDREHEEAEDPDHEENEFERNTNTIGSDPIVIAVIEPETGEIEPRFAGHQSVINSIRFSNDGRQMVTGSTGRNVIIWDVSTGDILHTIAEISVVLDAMFVQDNTAILTIVEDGDPALWRSTPFTLEEAIIWASENRAVRAADESECRRYQMQDFCE